MSFVSMPRQDLLLAIDSLAQEKQIDREIVIESLEVAIAKIAKHKYGEEFNIVANIDRKNGAIHVKRLFNVIESADSMGEDYNPNTMLTVDQAKKYAKSHGILVDKGNNYYRTSTKGPVTPWDISSSSSHQAMPGSTEPDKGSGAKPDATTANKGGFIVYPKNGSASSPLDTSGKIYVTKEAATAAALDLISRKYGGTGYASYTLYGFAKGGLVDFTGPAIVHGSKSKPEAFLNAKQTAQFLDAAKMMYGKETVLEGLRGTIAELRSAVSSITTTNNSNDYSVNIAPGAITVQVAEIGNSYDIEDISNDIMERIVKISNKATNRGVNRR